eukprot:4531344-Pyramimonas_sp.AAC.2
MTPILCTTTCCRPGGAAAAEQLPALLEPAGDSVEAAAGDCAGHGEEEVQGLLGRLPRAAL